MATCPKCNSRLSLLQIFKHTKWTPVVCHNCNAILDFNRKSWYKISFPLLILFILNLILKFTFNVSNSLMYHIVFFILVTLAFVKFFIDLKSIKLDIAVNKKNDRQI